jgi:outer membrane protein assembly factor BamB
MRRRRLLAVASSSLAIGGCLDTPSRQESPTPGSDTPTERNGTGPTTDREADTPTERSGPVRWRAGIGGRIPAPAVDDGSVYAVSTSGIHAFATADGRRRWSHSTPRSAWLGPAVGGGVVYAAGDGALAAFDAASGAERWRHTWPDETVVETMPVVGERAVFVGVSGSSTDRTASTVLEDLWAVDRGGGSRRWKRDSGERDRTGGVLSGPPVLHGGTLYVQTRRGTVMALDPSDGSDRWGRRFDGTSGMGGPTLVAEAGLLVVSAELRAGDRGRQWALVALGTDEGEERWRVTGIQTAPVSDGTTVYGGHIADSGGESTVFALSAADGSERWQFTKPGRLKMWSSLSTVGGTLYASFTERTGRGDVNDDHSTLYAVGTDGTEHWRFERRCEGFSRAAGSADTVYVAGRYGDGTLYALAPER